MAAGKGCLTYNNLAAVFNIGQYLLVRASVLESSRLLLTGFGLASATGSSAPVSRVRLCLCRKQELNRISIDVASTTKRSMEEDIGAAMR